MKWIVVTVMALFVIAHGAMAFGKSDEGTLEQIGLGTGSVVGSVIYFPLKTVLCAAGGLGSIYTRIFVGPQSTHKLVSNTCRGTWAITPHHFRGEESVQFIGDVPPYGPDLSDGDDSTW